MFTVQVEKTIACAHQLFGYNGPCEKLHGHNYRILVIYKGERLDEFGMLVDFSEVKKRFFAILDRLDHTYLNDLPEFKTVSPSAENIAKLVYTELASNPFELANLDEVQVWETPTQMAAYRE
jgi:6-pyruvoyltetrahydropterin/6-carboxytetrahydropterin synthase